MAVAANTASTADGHTYFPLSDLPTDHLVAMAADPALLDTHLSVFGTAAEAAAATAAAKAAREAADAAHVRRVCELSAAEKAAAENDAVLAEALAAVVDRRAAAAAAAVKVLTARRAAAEAAANAVAAAVMHGSGEFAPNLAAYLRERKAMHASRQRLRAVEWITR